MLVLKISGIHVSSKNNTRFFILDTPINQTNGVDKR